MVNQLQVENFEFKVHELGEGPTIVLLHGFGGGPLDWEPVSQSLIQNYKVCIPNLTPLFSSFEQISFTRQVDIVCQLVNQITHQSDFHLVGASYGGSLSWGVRIQMPNRILTHVLINPMPFDPLKSMDNQILKSVFVLSKIPGALETLSKTELGFFAFKKLAKVFRMGLGYRGKLKHFNDRRVRLIKKAIQRFLWIIRNEDWKRWSQLAKNATKSRSILIYGTKDALFNEYTYLDFQDEYNIVETVKVEGGGHLLARSRPTTISRVLKEKLIGRD